MKNIVMITRPISEYGEGTGIAVASYWLYTKLTDSGKFKVYVPAPIFKIPLYRSVITVIVYDFINPIIFAIGLRFRRVHVKHLVFIEPTQAAMIRILKVLLKPKKTTLIIHDVFFSKEKGKRSLYASYLDKLYKHSLRHADMIITTTKENREVINDYYPAHPPVIILPLGLTLIDNSSTAALFVEKDAVIVGYLGSSTSRKRLERLIQLAELNIKAGIKFQFLLAGPIHKKFINQLNILHKKNREIFKVKYLGIISESVKADFYRTIDVFIFPTREEGYGLPILESMYFGKPCIVFEDAVLPHIFASRCIVDSGDFSVIFRVERKILESKQLAKKLFAQDSHANQVYAKSFDWQNYYNYFSQ